MKRFQPAILPPEASDVQAVATRLGVPLERAQQLVEGLEAQRVYMNDRYQVNISDAHVAPGWPPMYHLSIKRLDKKPIRDWRDMQQIKNELVGLECEGVEMYPADSRVVDAANQYHLWVLKSTLDRFPFGFTDGGKGTPEEAMAVGAKQR